MNFINALNFAKILLKIQSAFPHENHYELINSTYLLESVLMNILQALIALVLLEYNIPTLDFLAASVRSYLAIFSVLLRISNHLFH